MLRSGLKRNHAVVIGGGIAGLLAARVLTDHFERVTLIERDHYPKEPVAHELRNEPVEELIVRRESESSSEQDSQPRREKKSRGG